MNWKETHTREAGLPLVGYCRNVDGRFIRHTPHSDIPHVGFRSAHLSRMKKSQRKELINAERYYKTCIANGDDESLFLLMLLYAAADERDAVTILWKWLRDQEDRDYFLGFVAYYLSMVCVMGAPLLKEVIAFLAAYYDEAKPYFPETKAGVEKKEDNTFYDKEVIFRYLDNVFLSGRQTEFYSAYTH